MVEAEDRGRQDEPDLFWKTFRQCWEHVGENDRNRTSGDAGTGGGVGVGVGDNVGVVVLFGCLKQVRTS